MHGVNAAKNHPASQKTSISDARPNGGSNSWELVILDAAPPYSTETGATGAADIDGDGKTELIISTRFALRIPFPLQTLDGDPTAVKAACLSTSKPTPRG